MRQIARALAFAASVALIIYGMIQPVEQDTRWLLALWLAAPLLLMAARFSLPPQPRGISRSVQNLGLVIALGFVLLSLQLMRQQFVRADDIYNTVHVDEQTGQTTSNVRQVIESLRVRRGKMIDSKGVVLVDSQVVDRNFVTRTYPLTGQYDPAAFSNIIGYFSSRFGQSGLEATYGPYLSGDRDSYTRLRDSLLGNPQVGDDLHLTIDARLQAVAAGLLSARGTGSVVVLDPKTGAVLAMASNPGFDPSQLALNPAADRDAENTRIDAYWTRINSDNAGQPLLNRPTQGRYPPGSTYKTVTSVGVLQNPDVGKPDDIRCFNELETEPGAPPVVNAVPDLASRTGDPSNLERVYAYSCNVAFAQYALRLGPDLFAKTAAQFDIFEPRDAPKSYGGFTDLTTEASTLYKDPGYLNRKAGLADTGFGQGQLQVTPLQMAMVASAIANDGWMMQPYLVDRVTRPDGSVVMTHGPRAIRRALSSGIAAEMRKNMRAGVEYGFGKSAQQVDPSVALVGGKSGTAETPSGVPHAWFIAIAPVDNPRYAVAVMVENGGEGSTVGARLAGDVLRAAFELEK
ncbi:MAG: penicillin-binding protein 2 [Kouleothrix sp.]|nr:penicillin-binding protein 2 [Kouleothrix sp.]